MKKQPANLNSRDLSLLVPEFRARVDQLIAACERRSVKMTPYCTLIGPGREAELFCSSRTWAQVQPTAERLRTQGAGRLAALLTPNLCWNGQGKRPAWKSNALPGQSAHVWGEAVDCFVADSNGRAIWDPSNPGYDAYAEEAERLGLTSGHRWSVRDSVHVQLRPVRVGSVAWAPAEQQRLLLERFIL